MKRILIVAFLFIAFAGLASAQEKQAKIDFDKITHDFGTFSESNPTQECVFTFTNKGDAPLVINQALASCGCTVPAYTKEPIAPGKKGEIKVTYNGRGKFPGHFKKSITVRCSGKPEMVRLYIEGVMEEAQKQAKENQ